MEFTREDLEKISSYIAQNGVKDSSFNIQKTLTGDEWFTIVSPVGNKKIKASVLYNLFIGKTGSEFLKNGIQRVESLEDLDSIEVKVEGNLVYVVSEDAYYSYSNKGYWEQILKLYIGEDEPLDSSVLWIDPSGVYDYNNEDTGVVGTLIQAVKQLQDEVSNLTKLITVGIKPGDSTTSYRMTMMEAEPEAPEEIEDPIEEDKPETSGVEFTVLHNCAKQDTSINFGANKQNLIDGELLFYTDKKKFVIYYDGKFYSLSSSESSQEDSGLTVDDLYKLALDYLIFSYEDKQYKVKVNSGGKWTVTQYSSDITLPGNKIASWNVYVSHLLNINSIYCGGEGGEKCLCSHNYIELANGSKKDINLNGLYLLYSKNDKSASDDIGYIWDVLPLEGVIKAGSTFVIRGAQCNTPKSCFINVDSYDLEWRKNGELIKFNQDPASFYLVVGEGFKSNLENKTLNNPWLANEVRIGYIDSCGFGARAVCEGSSSFLVNSDWDKTLFVRWFMFEPAKQGNKAHSARKSVDLWTYIDLERQTSKEGNSIQYYYNDELKAKYKPQASYLGKDFFTIKTKFSEIQPNIINVTFGMQATDNGDGATRCFNWVSVGYYDEYVEYRKKGESSWIKQYSYIENDSSNTEAVKKFIQYYKRLRWCTSYGVWVTTHKTIVHGLGAGVWEYRIGRDGNSKYTSDVQEFTVHSNDEVSEFSFIQTSDQQGFNWAEYTAWKKSSYMISKNESNYNFIINTGDITQSGNRPSEWLDYYNGREYLKDKEEMFTIGNNDLCGYISTELTDGEDATSKYNHINVLRYYTFELNPENEYEFTWNNNKYPLYSVYSFNYGDYHFISLNSEITKASSKMYVDWESDTYAGDENFAKEANAYIEEWLLKDLQLWTKTENPTNCSKCIVYCHEMPFTIVTWAFMSGSAARVGSKLNIYNKNGNYRFSRLFKKYGIKLVMGGHKHTYCITKPVYDAPLNYISGISVNPDVDLMGDVTNELSRRPVIQVTREQDVESNNYARYELVDKLGAPTYVMTQATGYKLVSNKEQPSDESYVIPWLLSYFKQPPGTGSGTKENVAQHRPMYIRYDLSGENIKITANQIHNIWNVNTDKNSKSFNFNEQLKDLEIIPTTLNMTSDKDKEAYNITETESYTIKL